MAMRIIKLQLINKEQKQADMPYMYGGYAEEYFYQTKLELAEINQFNTMIFNVMQETETYGFDMDAVRMLPKTVKVNKVIEYLREYCKYTKDQVDVLETVNYNFYV